MKFKTLKANEYCDSVRDGTHDSPKKVEKGYKLITSKNIKEYGLDLQNASNISKKDYDKVNERSLVEKNDILYSMIGTIGLIHRVNYEPNYAIKNIGLFKIKDEQKSKWLYYYLKTPKMKNYINSLLAGSTQQYITLNNLRELPIQIPEFISDTNKIIYILDLIETKITNNTHTNNNLQELLLYKYNSYFQGKISNGKLKDIVLKTNRTIKKDKINESLKYYPIDVLPKNNIILQDGKSIEEAQSSLIEFNKNEILVGAMRVYFHRVCLTNNSGITRNTTFVLKPKDEDYLYYSLLTLYQDNFIDYASITSKGTTMPYAVWENVCSEFDIYIPTKEELEEFNIVCKAIINKMNINQAENQNLEQIRDTLLPKLMNGEIDLDKVEI